MVGDTVGVVEDRGVRARVVGCVRMDVDAEVTDVVGTSHIGV